MSSEIQAKAGVVGWPVKHSLSPRLHRFWLRKYGIDGEYVALPVEPENLTATLKYLSAQKFRGVNLTVPHKEAALSVVEAVDPLARRVGAINTVLVQPDGTLLGRNTDVFGFTENLREGGYKIDHRPVTLLGAGGAARAALVALADMGVQHIRIVNRSQDKAEALARHFTVPKIEVFSWDNPQALEHTGLLINATSLGLVGQPPLEINLESLPLDAFVTDMVYVPLKTDLLQRAEKRGNPVIDGLGMLLHQARPAFQAFFGVDPAVTPELRRHVMEGM